MTAIKQLLHGNKVLKILVIKISRCLEMAQDIKSNEATDTKLEVEVVDDLIFDTKEFSKKQLLDSFLSGIGVSPLNFLELHSSHEFLHKNERNSKCL